jgi:hypothetical protein
MFQHWRRLLQVVADLHKLGYEGARIIPFIVDTAGGGDWHCFLAPAAMVSPSHGARIGEAIDWWGGACPPGRDFPYLIGRCVHGLPGLPPELGAAKGMIRAYPKLAEHCLGHDRGYAEWYRAMLRTTEPDGVVYAHAYWDSAGSPAVSGLRVLGPEGEWEVAVPLPPPGAAPADAPSGGKDRQVPPSGRAEQDAAADRPREHGTSGHNVKPA